MRSPVIPMAPGQRPRQHLWLLTAMPEPDPMPEIHCYPDEVLGAPQRINRNAEMLCHVEWAWGPMNGSLEAYYIHRGRGRWILWVRAYGDDDGWTYMPLASCPSRGLGEWEAAMLLLAFYFDRRLAQSESFDCFHWINEVGMLDVGDLEAIADAVWGARTRALRVRASVAS